MNPQTQLEAKVIGSLLATICDAYETAGLSPIKMLNVAASIVIVMAQFRAERGATFESARAQLMRSLDAKTKACTDSAGGLKRELARDQ